VGRLMDLKTHRLAITRLHKFWLDYAYHPYLERWMRDGYRGGRRIRRDLQGDDQFHPWETVRYMTLPHVVRVYLLYSGMATLSSKVLIFSSHFRVLVSPGRSNRTPAFFRISDTHNMPSLILANTCNSIIDIDIQPYFFQGVFNVYVSIAKCYC
jgi:hypothetical protein